MFGKNGHIFYVISVRQKKSRKNSSHVLSGQYLQVDLTIGQKNH